MNILYLIFPDLPFYYVHVIPIVAPVSSSSPSRLNTVSALSPATSRPGSLHTYDMFLQLQSFTRTKTSFLSNLIELHFLLEA